MRFIGRRKNKRVSLQPLDVRGRDGNISVDSLEKFEGIFL
jgi:hypothetical protein